jgi:chitinase
MAPGRSASRPYDATNLTNQIVTDLPAGAWDTHNKAFLIPTVANGKVYVAAYGELSVFGLGGSAPTINIIAPAFGATVSGQVSIADQVSTGVSWIDVYIDGTYLTSSPPYSFTWNSASVADRPHTISATAFDSSGIPIGSSSVTINVNNTTASAVTIKAPANGATVSGNVSIATQVTTGVSWTDVYIDGTYLTSSPPYSFTWNSASVADGSHTISVTAFSSSGTVIGTSSTTVNVAN